MRLGPIEIRRQQADVAGPLAVAGDAEMVELRARGGLSLADGPLVVGGDTGEPGDVLGSRGPSASPLWIPGGTAGEGAGINSMTVGFGLGDEQEIVGTTLTTVLSAVGEPMAFTVREGHRYAIEVLGSLQIPAGVGVRITIRTFEMVFADGPQGPQTQARAMAQLDELDFLQDQTTFIGFTSFLDDEPHLHLHYAAVVDYAGVPEDTAFLQVAQGVATPGEPVLVRPPTTLRWSEVALA